MAWDTDWRTAMFPKLQRKFVLLYTLSTGLIITFILSITFLFYFASQENRQESLFQKQLFTLISQLQSDSRFTDLFLAQLEQKNQLIIHIEENGTPFFFPGSYRPDTERETLLAYAEKAANKEGIFTDSYPISSNMLQTSIFQISGDRQDVYLGNVLVLLTPNGYKKLTLLQDITDSRKKAMENGYFYLFIDLLGILLLFLSGRWFVRRSLRPLEETYQRQQDFVAAASHELRSPIAVIQLTSDAISSQSAEDTRLLSVIKSECRRGSTLIKNLLLLASAEQKEWAVRKRKFEIDELLLDLLELYEPLCHSKSGTLQLRLPEEPLPQVSADPELCRQILTILLDNAIAYSLTHPSKNILLQAEHCHPHTLIYVVDHGPGIPDEEKEFIFDRFYKSDKSRNKKEHFGLGLSIAITLAKIQGIKLGVQDTDGGGSTFYLEL